MRGTRAYGNVDTIAVLATAQIVVDPGARLTIYTSAPCTLGWASNYNGTPDAWTITTAAAFTWPVDVPEGVNVLTITAGALAPVAYRLTYASS